MNDMWRCYSATINTTTTEVQDWKDEYGSMMYTISSVKKFQRFRAHPLNQQHQRRLWNANDRQRQATTLPFQMLWLEIKRELFLQRLMTSTRRRPVRRLLRLVSVCFDYRSKCWCCSRIGTSHLGHVYPVTVCWYWNWRSDSWVWRRIATCIIFFGEDVWSVEYMWNVGSSIKEEGNDAMLFNRTWPFLEGWGSVEKGGPALCMLCEFPIERWIDVRCICVYTIRHNRPNTMLQ